MQLFSIWCILVHFVCLICYFVCFWYYDAVCSNVCSCCLCWCIHICNDCCWICIAIPNEVSIREPFFWCCYLLYQIHWDFDGCPYTLALSAASLRLFYVLCGGWYFLNDCQFGPAIPRIRSSCKPWPANQINNKNIRPWWRCDGVI